MCNHTLLPSSSCTYPVSQVLTFQVFHAAPSGPGTTFLFNFISNTIQRAIIHASMPACLPDIINHQKIFSLYYSMPIYVLCIMAYGIVFYYFFPPFFLLHASLTAGAAPKAYLFLTKTSCHGLTVKRTVVGNNHFVYNSMRMKMKNEKNPILLSYPIQPESG